jgi:hypothetical protein
MARDMRFLQQREPRDPPSGKLVPERFPDRMQAHLPDQANEERTQSLNVRDGSRVAMMRFDDPLTP